MSNKKYASLQTLQTFLANLKNRFSELSHEHTLSDITDYVVDAELSENSTNPVQNKVINAELDAVATAMNALDLVVSNKANANHDHNDIYYTKEELDEVIQNNSSQMDFVSYNPQDLTGEQKSQARKNIGVSEMIADTLIAMDLISSVVEDEGGSLAEEDGVLLVVRNDELFLPKVTTENNGSVLQVVDGAWTPGEIEIPEVDYPVTSVNGMTGDVVIDVPSVDGFATEAYVSETITKHLTDTELILTSSTSGSTKKFKITIDDDGVLTATEIVESAT